MFADIAGFTRQVSRDENEGLERRRRVEQLIKGCAVGHSGRVVKTIGDAVMLEFQSAVEAVSCALVIQNEMRELNRELGTREPLQVRVGIHVGDVVEEDHDLYGNGVNIAQRVQTIALPGGICISREVYVQIRPILKLRCEPVSRQPTKDMPEAVEVFQVTDERIETGIPGSAASGAVPHEAGRLDGVLARTSEINIHDCFDRSWQAVRSRLGLLMLATMALVVLSGAVTSIPVGGPVIALGLLGPVKGGYSWLVLKAVRGRPCGLRDLLFGFGPMLTHVVLVSLLADFPLELGLWLARNVATLSSGGDREKLTLLVLLFVAWIPSLYLYAAWFFARLLVMDKGLAFWPALDLSRRVVSQRWPTMVALLVLSHGVALLGLLILGIGFLLTVPIGVGATVSAYEELFREVPARTAQD